jgi:predicted dinucleotide-binding enzyme
MRIGVLGTGIAGRTIATKLIQLGHEVQLGSRTADNEAALAWADANGDSAGAGTFADVAAAAELVFNCTAGGASVEVLRAAGADNLEGKVLVDVSNPLDFSTGQLLLTVSNADSVGEQLQAAAPAARVVKALNTVNCQVMVQPSLVPGEHSVFVCGNDEAAKRQVIDLLGAFGWPAERVIDLGDITGSRATEMYLPLWVRLMGRLGTPLFNVVPVQAP